MSRVVLGLEAWADLIHNLARIKGWWEGERNVGEAIALIHSEASELLEAERKGNPESKKIPGFSAAEEESADIIIRTLDLARGRGYRITEAIEAKHQYNRTRPHRHGKKF
jgi:NTP pyrophosphatase (non-canonical NTP hydrolase)